MTSRLNSQQNSLTFGNTNTHIFTEFSTFNKESTQEQVLQAIKDINISAEIGDITVESSDTITHERLTNTNIKLEDVKTKLDTIDTTILNKHLDSTTDSVNIGNFPTSFEVSNLLDVPLISGFATEETLSDIKTKTDNLTLKVKK
jgi:hypothetical protein